MHAPSLVDVPPAVTNPGMVFRVGSIFSSPNCAQGAVVSQSEGAPCISSSPKHSLVMVTAQDKRKEVVFSSKNDRTTVLPMDTIPPARKLSWKRRAHTSNDSRLIEMKDLPSLKRAASFKDDVPFSPGQVRWGHRFKFESCWADMDPCRDIIKRSWADEEYWRQQARTSWLASGDKNTKYFHFKSNQRRKRNSLLGLFNSSEEWKSEIDDMEAVIHDYFQNIFKSSVPSVADFCAVTSCIDVKVSPAMNHVLD
ncbi:hypothetical protein ACOSQ2_000759 [Xanthoceras sorbifolium]